MTSIAHLPKTYKAITVPKPKEDWLIVDKPLREPGPDEILIRVHASGICFSDHFVKEGTWPGLPYPKIPGHEMVGRVAAVGSNILTKYGADGGRFKVGTLSGVGWNGGYCNHCEMCRNGDFWICSNGNFTGFTIDGGHAEYMYAPETSVVTLDEDALKTATYAELAPLLCAGATVYDAIRASTWSPGDLCVVQGIGGLGHLAVQFAAKMGLKVYAVSSGSRKKDLSLSLGAVEYIDASTTDVVKYIQSLGGAKLVLTTAPYAKHVSDIIPAVGKNGTVMICSAATDKPLEVWNLTLNLNRATVKGWCCGCAQDMEKCVRFAQQTGVKTIVQEFPFDSFLEAYQGVVDNKSNFRNVIVFP
ncbi:hypothetical protein ONZ45_g6503 [Pleurotus djamor]|nr:hypothetical protein ONZ45_g6503 [Pleurotus djamor]